MAADDQQFGKDVVALVISRDTSVSHQLRGTLLELGIVNVTAEYTHSKALSRVQEKKFTHLFFDSEKTDMDASEFIRSVKELRSNVGLIALASQLNVNDVFDLLRRGARSFLLYPFTFEAVENSIKYINQEYEIREELLQGDQDMSSTLTEVALTNFNMLCRLMSLRAEGKGTLELEALIKERKQVFCSSVDLAKGSSEPSPEGFRDKIVEMCLNHAMETGSRLSRVRKKLKQQRQAPAARQAR